MRYLKALVPKCSLAKGMDRNSSTTVEQLRGLCEKLRRDYLRVKEQRAVLKRAILQEKQRTADLEALLGQRDEDRQEVLSEIDRLNFDNQRLKVRITQMMREIELRDQQQSEARRASSGVGGGLLSTLTSFATGDGDEVRQLRDDMAVVMEELRVKIEENEQTHIRCFDLERRRKETAAELQALRTTHRDARAEHAAELVAKEACVATLSDQCDALTRTVAARRVDLRAARRDAAEKGVELLDTNVALVRERDALRVRLRRSVLLDERSDPTLRVWDLDAVDVAGRARRSTQRRRIAMLLVALERAALSFARARGSGALRALHRPGAADDTSRSAIGAGDDGARARQREGVAQLREALGDGERALVALTSAAAPWAAEVPPSPSPSGTLHATIDALLPLAVALSALAACEHAAREVEDAADERAGAVAAEQSAEAESALCELLAATASASNSTPPVVLDRRALQRGCEALHGAARAYFVLSADRADRARVALDARTPSAPALGANVPDAADGASLRGQLRRERRVAVAVVECARDVVDVLDALADALTDALSTASASAAAFEEDANETLRVLDVGAAVSVERERRGLLRTACVSYLAWCAERVSSSSAASTTVTRRPAAAPAIRALPAPGAAPAEAAARGGAVAHLAEAAAAPVEAPAAAPIAVLPLEQQNEALQAQLVLQEAALLRQSAGLERSEAACVAMRAACDERVRLLSRAIANAARKSQSAASTGGRTSKVM